VAKGKRSRKRAPALPPDAVVLNDDAIVVGHEDESTGEIALTQAGAMLLGADTAGALAVLAGDAQPPEPATPKRTRRIIDNDSLMLPADPLGWAERVARESYSTGDAWRVRFLRGRAEAYAGELRAIALRKRVDAATADLAERMARGFEHVASGDMP